MAYQVKYTQTVFSEERERRLRQMFEIILRLAAQKPAAGDGRIKGQNSEIRTVSEPANEIKGESKEDENMLADSESKR